MNRFLAACWILCTITTGCSTDDAANGQTPAPAGQPFEVLAGGGRDVEAGRALDAALIGRAEDLEVAPDGTAYLLIYSDGAAHLERIRPDGTRTRIKLMETERTGNQVTLGPDGSVYVNLYVNGDHDAIHRIRSDGSRQVVIGYQAAASTPDGGSARPTASSEDSPSTPRAGWSSPSR